MHQPAEAPDPNAGIHPTALELIDVVAPCHEDWDTMPGTEHRYCSICKQDVVNLSAHTRADAEALLQAHAPTGLCIRLARDEDGQVETQEGPKGEPIPKLDRGIAIGAFLTIVLVGAWLCGQERLQRETISFFLGPINELVNALSPPVKSTKVCMGAVVPPDGAFKHAPPRNAAPRK